VAVQRSATLGSQDGRRACNNRHRADGEWAAARQKPRGAPVRGRLTARDEGGDRALPLRRFPEKPFCDGTHRTNGFSSAAPGDGADDRRVDYVGRVITIHDNRALCAHAGVCTSALPACGARSARRGSTRTARASRQSSRRCAVVHPERSATRSRASSNRDLSQAPAILASANGPDYVAGGIELAGASFAAPHASTTRSAGAATRSGSRSATGRTGPSALPPRDPAIPDHGLKWS
jgi:hypothetical protein